MSNNNKKPTNKRRLKMIFDGKVPDVPPHFELAFQLEKAMLGIDVDAIANKEYASEKEKNDAIEKTYIEVQTRLVDEFDYAAVPAYHYPDNEGLPRTIKQLKDAGLHLSDVDVVGCRPRDEALGCMDILHDVGIPCGKGKSCHNYLFSRSSTKE